MKMKYGYSLAMLCSLLVVPNIAMASHSVNGLSGLDFLLKALMALALLFIVNLILFLTNIRRRSKARAITVAILSAPIVAANVFVCMSFFSSVSQGRLGPWLACAGIAAVHVAMMAKSIKMINELNERRKENE